MVKCSEASATAFWMFHKLSHADAVMRNQFKHHTHELLGFKLQTVNETGWAHSHCINVTKKRFDMHKNLQTIIIINSVRVHSLGISFSDVTEELISCQTALSLHLTSNQPPLCEFPSEYPGKHVKRTMLWWVVLSLEAVALATVGTVEPQVSAKKHGFHYWTEAAYITLVYLKSYFSLLVDITR